MQFEILKSISEIAKDEWNSIVEPDRLICRHEYLEAVENSKINDCRYFYPIVRDESGRLLAHTCLYFISTELDLFAKGVVKRGIQFVRKLWPGFLILRSLECGTPVALGNTISYSNGENAEILGEIVRAAEKVAVDIGVKVLLFRDFYDGDLAFYDQLQALGYKRIHNLPSVHMDVRWDSFDDYVSSLRSSYRHRLKHREKMFHRMGGKIQILESFEQYSDTLLRLWENTFEKSSEYKREILTASYFEEMSRLKGGDSSIIMATIDDLPIGFCLMLKEGPLLSWVFSGLNYSKSHESFAYFNMIYAIIKHGIRHGFEKIDFGITTVVPKLDVGGQVTPQFMYMRHLRSIMSPLTPTVFDCLTPQPREIKRNVFKNANTKEGTLWNPASMRAS